MRIEESLIEIAVESYRGVGELVEESIKVHSIRSGEYLIKSFVKVLL